METPLTMDNKKRERPEEDIGKPVEKRLCIIEIPPPAIPNLIVEPVVVIPPPDPTQKVEWMVPPIEDQIVPVREKMIEEETKPKIDSETKEKPKELVDSSSGTENQVPEKEVTVVLNVFSGRANPTWTLTGEEAAQFHTYRSRFTMPMHDVRLYGLGYRGFTITQGDAEWQLCHGQLMTKTSNMFDDVDPELVEKWLVGTAKPPLSEELRTTVMRTLKQPAVGEQIIVERNEPSTTRKPRRTRR